MMLGRPSTSFNTGNPPVCSEPLFFFVEIFFACPTLLQYRQPTCLFACTYVCIACMCVCTCIYIYIYVCVYGMYLCACMCVCAYIYKCMHVCMYAHVRAHLDTKYACMCIYLYMIPSMFVCAFIYDTKYVCMYMFVCAYMCMCVYMHLYARS
jgi:hypothetical protein